MTHLPKQDRPGRHHEAPFPPSARPSHRPTESRRWPHPFCGKAFSGFGASLQACSVCGGDEDEGTEHVGHTQRLGRRFLRTSTERGPRVPSAKTRGPSHSHSPVRPHAKIFLFPK